MQSHSLLQDATGQVFLIHCIAGAAELQAALLVVDGFISDGWLQISEPSSAQLQQQGSSYLVRLPAEVIGQPERYKGYDVVLPLKRIA